jgi:hypothetical protein
VNAKICNRIAVFGVSAGVGKAPMLRILRCAAPGVSLAAAVPLSVSASRNLGHAEQPASRFRSRFGSRSMIHHADQITLRIRRGSARILLRMWGLLAVVCAIFSVLSSSDARAHADKLVHAMHATGRKPGAISKSLRFSCPDALDDGTLTDSRQADVLVDLAAAFRQAVGARDAGDASSADDDRGTARGRRDVHLICGPDLDGDGDRESVVRIVWWPAAGVADESPFAQVLLASKHQGLWRIVADLGVDTDADQQPPGETVTFVRPAGGKLAIRVERSSFTSDTGCRIVGYEVFALQSGTLHRLAAGDNSPPCTPCGCDPH